MTETWQPVLEGELAAQAWDAIFSIAEAIGPPPEVGPDLLISEWALAGGAAGTALFYAYLAETTGDEAQSERACSHLEAAMAAAASQPRLLGLWEGVLGVAWIFDHLEGRLFDAEEGEEREEESDADGLLARLLEARDRMPVYDLIQGLAGYGVACLEGLPRPGARRGLELILDHLLRSAESHDEGLAWFTSPDHLPPWQRELAPDGYYNLGVAHGMPAVMTLLARCIQAGIRPTELQPALDRVVAWILARRGDNGFPSWVAKGKPPQTAARLAWCYGDPGIAGALLAAGRAAGEQSWQAEAEDIARCAARRDPEMAGIQDAGICHGAAGLAHIFNRLYQGTGSEELAAASRHWFAETLAMRQPGRGIGGYQAWSVPRGQYDDTLQWVDDPGLLTGAAGIGLCLLATVADQEPAWDRSLFLSTAEREPALAA